METNALFVILGVIGILVLIFLSYGIKISYLIFDFKWKKIRIFWRRFQRFFETLIHMKTEKVRGKIIRLKTKKFLMINSSFGESESVNSLSLINNQQSVTFTGYFVFFEEEENHKKYFVEISKESFDELKKKDISSLKNISLLFEKWFWSENFHHYEIT